MGLNGRGEGAAEKNGASRIDLQQCVTSFGEIKPLDEPSVQPLRPTDVRVEFGKVFDLDQASSHERAR